MTLTTEEKYALEMTSKVRAFARIERAKDEAELRAIARELVNLVATLLNSRASGPDNYDVMRDAIKIASGTKEYCLGYAQGQPDWNGLRVVCGSFEVWPEYGFDEPK